MNKINIFWKHQVSCALFRMLQNGFIQCQISIRAVRWVCSRPKIYMLTGHLWHHTAALTLDITALPCDSQAFWLKHTRVNITQCCDSDSPRLFSCCKCRDKHHERHGNLHRKPNKHNLIDSLQSLLCSFTTWYMDISFHSLVRCDYGPSYFFSFKDCDALLIPAWCIHVNPVNALSFLKPRC